MILSIIKMSDEEPDEFIDDANDKSYSPRHSDSGSESGDDGLRTRDATSSRRPRRSDLWDHFGKIVNNRVVCRHCRMSLAYRGDSISNLRKHLRSKHPITAALLSSSVVTDDVYLQEMNTEELVEVETKDVLIENGDQKGRKHGRSVWWKYFRPVTEQTSVCLTCHKVLRHATSISNLGKHIQRKHLRNNETLICHDSKVNIDNDDDVDHLRHSDDNDSVQDGLDVSHSTTTDTTAEQETDRKRLASVPHEVMLEDNVLDEELLNKEEDIFTPPKSKKSKLVPEDQWEASLNRFGSYVASLMKMLPREKAAKFQVQIINRLLQERFTT